MICRTPWISAPADSHVSNRGPERLAPGTRSLSELLPLVLERCGIDPLRRVNVTIVATPASQPLGDGNRIR